MRKEKREKIIKKIFDEEFGPNLSVDEICSEIDFTHQNGVKVVKEEAKPFYKKPIFMKLAYVCLLLVCVLSTFVITRNTITDRNNFHKIYEVLDYEEIKYLEENDYKYETNIFQSLVINDEVIVYSFITNNNNIKSCWLKIQYIKFNNNSLKVFSNKEVYIFNEKTNLQNIGILDLENKISFSFEYNGIVNEYSIQCN